MYSVHFTETEVRAEGTKTAIKLSGIKSYSSRIKRRQIRTSVCNGGDIENNKARYVTYKIYICAFMGELAKKIKNEKRYSGKLQ